MSIPAPQPIITSDLGFVRASENPIDGGVELVLEIFDGGSALIGVMSFDDAKRMRKALAKAIRINRGRPA